jgi:hypothetical protein
MLKLVKREAQRRRGKAGPAPSSLTREIGRAEEIGNSLQRVIATGRRGIIEVNGRLHRGASESSGPAAGAPAPAGEAAGESDLARNVTEIHQRLLFFAASVELEMDRLEMVRKEIDRLPGTPARPDEKP